MKREHTADRMRSAQTLGRYRDAIKIALAALADDPDDAEMRYALGRSYWHLDQLDEADAVARSLLKSDPEQARHHGLLGDVYHSRAGRSAIVQAITHFEEAQRLDPDPLAWAYQLANALFDLERHAQAATLLDTVLADDPEDVEALALRARIALAQDDKRGAARLSRRALRLEPGGAHVHQLRGSVAFDLGCYAVAERHYREMRRLEPTLVPWAQSWLIRESRYLQSPWYTAGFVLAGLVFAAPWPWKCLTMAAGGMLTWFTWPISGCVWAANLVFLLLVRTVLRLYWFGTKRTV